MAAKLIETRFGMAWGVLASDDPWSDVERWFNESEAQNIARRVVANAKKGFYVGTVRAQAATKIVGGLAAYPIVVRADGGFSRDVEIVDNGK